MSAPFTVTPNPALQRLAHALRIGNLCLNSADTLLAQVPPVFHPDAFIRQARFATKMAETLIGPAAWCSKGQLKYLDAILTDDAACACSQASPRLFNVAAKTAALHVRSFLTLERLAHATANKGRSASPL
jgi:hypothetical protein